MARKKSYVIVPIYNYVSEPIKAKDEQEALEDFAFQMDTDMSLYFKAIPEKDYGAYINRMEVEMHIKHVTNWMAEVLRDDFDVKDDAIAKELAEWAYERYCDGNGETEYECVEWAYDEHYEDYYHDDESEE